MNVRKYAPYDAYDKVEFDIPIGKKATATTGTLSGWKR